MGHRMDPAWRNDFSAFRDWALANGYGPGLSLNRRDKDKGYMPANCRWSKTWSRSHFTKPFTRSDGRIKVWERPCGETPRTNSYGITMVCRGLQKTCGGFTWRFDQPERLT